MKQEYHTANTVVLLSKGQLPMQGLWHRGLCSWRFLILAGRDQQCAGLLSGS